MEFMVILGWIALAVLIILATLGLALCVAGIGGTFIILLAALLYNMITWSMAISLELLALLAALAIIGEILEWVTPLVHGKTSWYAIAGVFVGAITGASVFSFIPFVGSIIGLFLGATLGAFVFELVHTSNASKAWKAAKAAFKSRIIISATKTVLAIIQIAILAATL